MASFKISLLLDHHPTRATWIVVRWMAKRFSSFRLKVLLVTFYSPPKVERANISRFLGLATIVFLCDLSMDNS